MANPALLVLTEFPLLLSTKEFNDRKQITAEQFWLFCLRAAQWNLGKDTYRSSIWQKNSASNTFARLRSHSTDQHCLNNCLKNIHNKLSKPPGRTSLHLYMSGLRGLSLSQIRRKLSAAFERSGGISGDRSSCLVL